MAGWVNSFLRRVEAQAAVAPHCRARHLVAVGLLAVLAAALTIAPAERSTAETRSLSGQLLVAEPTMPDPRFAETVILMISHDASGALGLIVNRRLGEIDIADLLEEMGRGSEGTQGTIHLHYGGPVEPQRGFILHSADSLPDGSNPVGEDFAVTGQADILRAIADGTGPKDSLFALGYAGWGPGQLEAEMERADWFTAPADPALVFTDQPAEVWRRIIDQKGIEL